MTSVAPAGPPHLRSHILDVAHGEVGVREVPPGSNRGPRVDVYLPPWARKHHPQWCAFFAGWVVHEATGEWLPGGHLGSCHRLMLAAQEAGRWVAKGDGPPMPGDVFIMDTDGDAGLHGHAGIVYRVGEDAINVVEGNSGHRVRLGTRQIDDPRILGWIITVPEENDFREGSALLPAPDLGRKGTR